MACLGGAARHQLAPAAKRSPAQARSTARRVVVSTASASASTDLQQTQYSRVRLKTRQDCELGVSFYPRFRYNALGGGGWGTVTDIGDGKLQLVFDASVLVIPDMSYRTAMLLGLLPIPPPLNIAIKPVSLEGILDTVTGEVNLNFESDFLFTAGPIYQPPGLKGLAALATAHGAAEAVAGRGGSSAVQTVVGTVLQACEGAQAALDEAMVADPIRSLYWFHRQRGVAATMAAATAMLSRSHHNMLAKCTPCKPARACGASRRAVVCQASNGFKATAAAVLLSTGLAVLPAMAGVSFAGLSGGAVSSPLHLEFLVDGLSVRPAADGLIPGTGHYHLVVDAPAPAEGTAIPFDDAHKHYGKGQTSADLELAPGKHTLTLQFANAAHESYGPAYARARRSAPAQRKEPSTMGGGNGQKSAMARARRQAEMAAASKGSQLKTNQASMTIKCNICLTTFVCTTNETMLKQHWESKHPKSPLEAAFPDLVKPAEIRTVLTTESTQGRSLAASGRRLVGGNGVLVGTATVEPIGDAFMDTFLQLPNDALAVMSCDFLFE
ncbi:hypothetical protein TSOC_005881 [Tetrabaena socialis]|uniref:DUF4399 domain-containing protein n=1 Tax=Tetrabaena socialis TaxID=47790 RepID=A0A2J8A563_9CHLO|nr:hypothetical protein TSOC_005881 [Tetrabaena socialis]|eukprot:PNH07645.1 hypothetical protein TSOC_005881 [Tetrabaena socialis]